MANKSLSQTTFTCVCNKENSCFYFCLKKVLLSSWEKIFTLKRLFYSGRTSCRTLYGRDFHDAGSRFSWWQVEIFMMTGRDFHDARSRFSWWQVEIFMMTGRDFHNDRSRFSWCQVKIFMMTGRDFHDDRSRFSWLQVKIFMMTSRDFHDDRSRFSWLQVEIFMMAVGEFYGSSSRFLQYVSITSSYSPYHISKIGAANFVLVQS